MQEKEQLIEIHETLEGIKKPFITIRKEHDITYYPDMLDAYHTVMEAILNELTGKESRSTGYQNYAGGAGLCSEGAGAGDSAAILQESASLRLLTLRYTCSLEILHG